MGWRNKKGDAMIAVIAIMTILITLCLAMLLAASVLISNAQKEGLVEQCRVSAVTLSKELDKDLCGPGSKSQRPLAAYLKENINATWPFYSEEVAEAGHKLDDAGVKRVFTSTGDIQAGETGDISITLYWGSEDGKAERSTLYMEVTAQRGGGQYTVTSVYDYLSGADSGDTLSWNLYERR